MLHLEDLRSFCAVAAAGSFSAAARTSNVPKATLSRRVAALERSLGVALLHRSTRRLEPTEPGRRLLQRAGPLLEELTSLGEEIEAFQKAPQGLLRLQLPAELLADELARLLVAFTAAYPAVTLQCSHYAGAAPADPASFDLTLLCYEWRLPPSDWIAVPFLSLRQGVFAAPGLGPSELPALADLKDVPALVAGGESVWHFRAGDRVEAVSVAGTLELDSPLMRLRAAERGGGIVKAPVLLAEAAVREGRLVPVALPHPPVALSVALFYRSRALPMRVRAFIDHLQSELIPPA